MLVLSRKLNEEIVIAGDIRVKILGINGASIRLGIEAPAHVPVLRHELQPRGDRFVRRVLRDSTRCQLEATN